MHEVIARVMEAETGARRITDAARTEADRILSDARTEARELAIRMRRDAQSEAERIVEESIQAAGQEKQSQLAQYSEELEARLPLDPSTRQQAVTAALECVCNPEP